MTGTADAHRPADAYYEMVEILGHKWLDRKPPESGVTVVVAGTDGVPTEWACTFEIAARLKPHVLARPNLRWLGSAPYFPRKETTT